MKETKSLYKVLIVAAFILTPFAINIGLVITDILFENKGWTLTATGLNNANWLDFWKQYLTITISFLGIYLVYSSSTKDREKDIREKNAQQYLDDVRKEENALVEIIQQFNPSVIYDSFLQHGMKSEFEGRKVLADIRTNIDHAHVKFEILTDLCDDFEKCKKCSYNPCADGEIMKELRKKYYVMEKQYWKMLELAEKSLALFENENARAAELDNQNALYRNTDKLINLYIRQGSKDVSELVEELKRIKERIIKLEKAKLQNKDIDNQIQLVAKELDVFNAKLRPEFIGYTKIYIDMKKEHARELRIYGEIKHKKQQEQKLKI